nr:MAG TPA: hypothetical protein [Caudoviricetes sp.]
MVGLTEFIIASRANKIIRNSRLSNLSYTAIDKNECGLYKDAAENFLSKNISAEEAVKYQKKLEDLLFFIFPGTTFNRFLGVEDTVEERFFYPITVAKITIMENTAYIPFFFGEDSIFVIAPFVKEEDSKYIGDKFVAPICKINEFEEDVPFTEFEEWVDRPTDKDNWLYGTASLRDRFTKVVTPVVEMVSGISNAISKTFPDFEYGMEAEVISVKEPGYSRMYEKFGIESEIFVDNDLGLVKNPEDIIREIDFLPIVLKHDTNDDSLSYVTLTLLEKKSETGEPRLMRSVDMRKVGEDTIRSASTVAFDSKAAKRVINDLLVLRETGSIYPLINLDEFAYYFNKSICFVKDGTVLEGFLVEDLYEVDKGYPCIKEVDAVTEDGIQYTKGEEGIGDIASAIKVLGIRVGSSLYGVVSKVFKLPKEIAKDVWNFIRRTFFLKQNDASKELTDELRVKALNDDLDVFSGKANRWLESGIIGVASFFLAGGIIWGCALWYVLNKVSKKYRAKAMEPLEHQINTNIQVIDMKIRFAESEGDVKKVEELMRYRGHLLLMKQKTENYKKEVTDHDQLTYSKVQEVERTGGGY